MFNRTLNSQPIKDEILISQFGRCGYCNISLHNIQIHWDHFIPWALVRGNAGKDNWVASCAPCNHSKSDKVFSNEKQIASFCLQMLKDHGSLADGWAEGTEEWQKILGK